jgi:predicted nucleic acid-binding protein
MVIAFIDTSALYALLDAADRAHEPAEAAYDELGPRALVTHRYVIVESIALVGRRHGARGVIRLIDELLPAIDVRPVDDETHESALAELVAAAGAGPSFVDRTSFAFMRRAGIETAFAIDRDFATAGFRVIPDMPRSLEVTRATES